MQIEDYQRMLQMLDSISEGFYALDQDFCFTYINAAAETYLGKTGADLLGKNIWSIYPELSHTEFYRLFHQALQKKIVLTYEMLSLSSHRWVEIRISSAVDGLFVGFHDIHERKMLEVEKNRLAVLVESSEDYIGMADLAQKVLYINPAGQRMVGLAPDEVTTTSILDYFPDWERERVLKLLELWQTRDHFIEEVYFRDFKTGRVFPVSWSAIQIRDPETREVIAYATISRDISQRKALEQALIQVQRKYKALVDSDVVGVIILDTSGKIYEANDAFLNMLGYSREDFVDDGLYWQDLTPQVDRANEQIALQQLREKGAFSPFEKSYLKRKGGDVMALVAGAMIDEERNLAIELILDISERKQLERQKDDFITMITHELKTPVTSMKGFTQLLQRRLTRDGQEQPATILGKVNMQIDKLTRLIEELLDTKGIEKGQMHFRDGDFDFDALVREVIDEVQQTTESHQIHLQGATQKSIYGDRDRIGQVIGNLLTNAIKYSPETQRVFVKLSSDSETLILCVQDFGPGISNEKQRHLFDRFYRVNGPAYQNTAGLGLGLYISSEIIKRYSGHIWVKSEEGDGSSFYFSLPVC